MTPKSDAQLLREYAERRSESAFTEIVTRYTNLVYAAALRQTGSPDTAADVTQSVFIGLAQSARALSPRLAQDATLAGWLCRSARNVSLKLRRDDLRRHSRERQSVENLTTIPENTPDWERLRPVLDGALSELSEPDYDALVMRFFNNQDFRTIGKALGASDDTAQKRVSRALDRLREHLSRRGITTTVGALSVVLTANAFETAPLGLAAEISIAALAQAQLTTMTTGTFIKAVTMTATQKGMIFATASIAVGAVIYEARQAAGWRTQAQDFQRQQSSLADQFAQLQRDRDDIANRLAALADENATLQSNSFELARARRDAELGGADPSMVALGRQVGFLKEKLEQMPEKKIPELQFLTPKDWADAVWEADLTTDDGVREAMSKLRESAINTFLNSMMNKALKGYVAANDGVLPPDLYQLKSYFDQPVTDALLQRYALLQTGKPDNSHDVARLVAPYADEDYDSNHAMSMNGAGGGRFNRVQEAVGEAVAAFSRKHYGMNPTDPSQITPYLKKQIDPATIQKYLAIAAANPPPVELGVMMPAVTAYREGNNGQDPATDLQLVPYLNTPEEQSAFLKLAQLPPEALKLAPAVKAYVASHSGQPPKTASDLSPYLATSEEQAALEIVMQAKNPPLK